MTDVPPHDGTHRREARLQDAHDIRPLTRRTLLRLTGIACIATGSIGVIAWMRPSNATQPAAVVSRAVPFSAQKCPDEYLIRLCVQYRTELEAICAQAPYRPRRLATPLTEAIGISRIHVRPSRVGPPEVEFVVWCGGGLMDGGTCKSLVYSPDPIRDEVEDTDVAMTCDVSGERNRRIDGWWHIRHAR